MKRVFVILIVLRLGLTVSAQDLGFGNPNQNLVNLNPSFAGSNGFIRNQLSFRDQRPGLSNNFTWACNNFDAYLKCISAGIAVTGQWESYNELATRKSYGLVYAQHLKLWKGSIKIIPSIQALYRTSDFNGLLTLPDQKYIDFNSGLLLSYKERLYVGGSVFHLAEKPTGGFYNGRDERKFTFHASYSVDIGEKSLIQFLFVQNGHQRYYSSYLMANAVLNNHYMVGAGYGSGSNLTGTLGYRASCFSVAYAYAMSVSKLSGNTAGSHELHLSYNLRNKERRDLLSNFERF
jgi:type IX secretion system PorP/SprF family membrane protein